MVVGTRGYHCPVQVDLGFFRFCWFGKADTLDLGEAKISTTDQELSSQTDLAVLLHRIHFQ